ncbi:MAG TPA: hypothetical protein PKX00_07805 [Opitutaceae bacterium]|jgi:hypothetical protein|nr:hypothetical protein [Opitutaceae bacterium]HRE05496.1 hypothetical protein [Opitutaceae bacterium]
MIARRIALLVTFFALTFSAQALPIVLTSNGGQTVTGVQNLLSAGVLYNVEVAPLGVSFNQAFGGDIPYFAVNGGAGQFLVDLASLLNSLSTIPTSIGGTVATQALLPDSNWAGSTSPSSLLLALSSGTWFPGFVVGLPNQDVSDFPLSDASGPFLVVSRVSEGGSTLVLFSLTLLGLARLRRARS